MKVWGVIIWGGLLWLAPVLSAWANSDVELFAPSGISVNYDPFGGLPGLEGVTLEVSYTGSSSDLPARLVITPEFGADFRMTGSGEPIEFEIVSNAGVMMAGRFEMPIVLAQNDQEQFDLTFKVPSGQYADAGTTDINLMVEIVDAATGQPLVPERVLNVAGDVPSRAQTNFAGTSPGYDNGIGTAHVDFGQLIPGDSRQVNFQVRGNANVMIAVSSENNGFMVNQEDAQMSPVPYSISADGIVSDLSSPLHLNRIPEKTLAGSSYPLLITLDPFEKPFAGVYRDTISIDVTPQ